MRTYLILLFALLLRATLAFAQIADSTQPPPALAPSRPVSQKDTVILNHADSLIGLELEGERARQLIGNVQFTHGRTVVTCDRAIQYLVSGKMALSGEVIVRDDSMALFTNRGMYYKDTHMAEGFDGVRIQEGKSTVRARYGQYFASEHRAFFRTSVSVHDSASELTSNELTYLRDQQRTVALGNVRIENPENKTVLFGEHFENDKARKYSIMTESPRAIEIDTAGEGKFDTLFLKSERMESYQDSMPRLITSGNVIMRRKDFAAEAGQGIFYDKTDSIELRKSPFVWFAQAGAETTQLSGDSIFVKLKKRKLDMLYVRGSAFAASQADSIRRKRYHQMSGQEIVIHFTANALDQINVNRTATLMYYVFDGTRPNGFNKTTGDKGVITFVKKKVDAVKMHGGVEGQFYPEKMVHNKEADYDLPGLNWKSPKVERFR